MKKCPYCGKGNADSQQCCDGCGTELDEEARSQGSEIVDAEHGEGFLPELQPADVSSIDMGFSIVEGFSRPDWKLIRQGIKESIPQDEWPQAWRAIARTWVAQLREDLGGSYHCEESERFLLLTAQSAKNDRDLLTMAEQSLTFIEGKLGPASLSARRQILGKRVLLVFSEQDDYYSYISYYYPEGHHSTSAGVFLGKGYGHIALPFSDMSMARNVIIHELMHNSLWGLPLPVWLNEGLSQRIERAITSGGRIRESPIVSRETAREHDNYWNEQNIQEFWAGTLFYRPGKGNELSYNLGEILVEVLSEKRDDFLNFILAASHQDAGQDAALKCLNRSLGDALGGFLGPGDWQPQQQIIKELWERYNQAKSDGQPS